MAARYWVGGTNTWNSTAGTKWAATSGGAGGETVPTAADDVYFSAGSTGTCTLSTTSVARSIDCTGFTGTISHPASTTVAIGDATAGAGNIALKFVSGMTYTIGAAATSQFSFVSSSATVQDIDCGGKTMATIILNNSSGSWRFSTAMTMNAAASIQLGGGTLDTNNLNHTWGILAASNTAVRTLNLGSSIISMLGASFDFTTNTNATLNAGTSTVQWVTSTSVTPTIAIPGLALYNVKVEKSSGGCNINGAGTSTFNNFTMDNTIVGSGNRAITINATGNVFINGVFTYIGNNASSSRGFLLAGTTGTTRTVALGTTGSVSFTNIDFRDIAITGTAAPVSGTSLGDGGGNSGITMTPAVTRYWVGTAGAGTSSFTEVGRWSTTSGGATGASMPIPQDTAIFDANSFPSTGQIVSMNIMRASSMDASAATNSPTFRFMNPNAASNTIHGDLIFPTAGCTIDATGAAGGAVVIILAGRGSHTLNTNGTAFGATISLHFTGPGGTYTLGANLTIPSDRTLTHNFGTLNANGFNVSVGLFSSSNSNTRAITMGSGQWTITGNNATVWNLATITNLTFTRGTLPIVFNYSGATGTRTITNGSPSLLEGSAPSISITAGTDTVSLANNWHDIDFTGFAGTLAAATRTVYGDFTLSTGMTLTDGANTTTFAATSGTKIITSNGRTMVGALNFNGAGGTWQLADHLVIPSGRTLTVTAGTFDANNKNVTAGLFNSNNTNTRTITMGSGTWTLSGTGTVWHTGTSTNLTLNINTAHIYITDTSSSSKTITPANGIQMANITITPGGAGAVILQGNVGTYGDINCTGGSKTITFSASPKAINGTLNLRGTAGNLITLNSSSAGSQASLSKSSGTVSCNYLSIQDIAVSGGAYWFAGPNSVDNGNNSGWIFTGPVLSFSDTVIANDTDGYNLARTLELADSVVASDAYTLDISQRIERADSVTVTDAIAYTLAYVRAFADSVTATDSRLPTYIKPLSDSVTTSDAMSKNPQKILTDSVTVSDLQVARAIKNLVDTITATDSRSLKPAKLLADSVTVSDSISKKPVKLFADAVATSDVRVMRAVKILADSVTASDNFAPISTRTLAFADSVAAIDAISKRYVRILTDTVIVTDSRVEAGSLSVILADTLTIADSFSKRTTKLFADSATISDAIDPRILRIISLADSVAATDTIQKAYGLKRADIVTAIDVQLAYRVLGMLLADTLVVSDSISKAFTKRQSDSVSLADASLARILVKFVLADTVGAYDQLRAFRNGENVIAPRTPDDAPNFAGGSRNAPWSAGVASTAPHAPSVLLAKPRLYR